MTSIIENHENKLEFKEDLLRNDLINYWEKFLDSDECTKRIPFLNPPQNFANQGIHSVENIKILRDKLESWKKSFEENQTQPIFQVKEEVRQEELISDVIIKKEYLDDENLNNPRKQHKISQNKYNSFFRAPEIRTEKEFE